ncbi:selenide, water dikinase SelD [Ferrimonas sediminicola]|uniref:Selenide, water dikinase n=1 Tax=Ferrimonas sediminicola TaxID=2569538 RepID=A0A4U1BA18_9GAMM|nr:selenide, water dikinase SelD [Ferrimonas sediminicola]TKB47652.1 selenide, water dikinase SelD [Ferrimonas sediminicola]
MSNAIKLTEYSHGAGCGCKISPKVLDTLLSSQLTPMEDARLLVGNASRDDAAVYDLDGSTGIISTTDFFMPIVDDPFTFGRIAATNAISDIYAMGGSPMMAIAIFGWPVNRLPPEVGQQVIEGGRAACRDAGILLAGGHSIDAPEPIFGLAVTGQVPLKQLKRNDTATAGSRLYLTKPLGIGILTTAQKQKKLANEHDQIAVEAMCQMNRVGAQLAQVEGVSAMTDVTGFGLAGHLTEICEGAGLSALLKMAKLPLLDQVDHYLALGCVPGGAGRNFDSYGHKLPELSPRTRTLLCDPQTSGGLLVAVEAHACGQVEALLAEAGLGVHPIGELRPRQAGPVIEVIE